MDHTNPDPPYHELAHYCGRVPGYRRHTRTNPSTIFRWCTRGVRLPDGTRLRLRAVRLGSRWATTDAWFDEFVATLTHAHAPAASVPARPREERVRASEAADARLRSLGM